MAKKRRRKRTKAILRKARRKHMRSMSHLKKYQFKKKGREMAKRRRRKRTSSRRRAPARRSSRRVTRRRGRRRGGGGGGYALMPGREDMKKWAACGAIGLLESKAKADDSFFVNKLPKPVDQIGFTGNLALALWVGSHFFHNSWLRLAAREAAGITTYQLGRMGKAYASGKDFFTVSGWTDDDVAQALEANMGALHAAGEGDMPGVPGINELMQYGQYGDGS